jgi:hypothetical protein
VEAGTILGQAVNALLVALVCWAAWLRLGGEQT